MKRQLPSQTLDEQFLSPDTRRAPLSETIRLGAQLMLQKAAELEVTDLLGRGPFSCDKDGPASKCFQLWPRPLGCRHG